MPLSLLGQLLLMTTPQQKVKRNIVKDMEDMKACALLVGT